MRKRPRSRDRNRRWCEEGSGGSVNEVPGSGYMSWSNMVSLGTNIGDVHEGMDGSEFRRSPDDIFGQESLLLSFLKSRCFGFCDETLVGDMVSRRTIRDGRAERERRGKNVNEGGMDGNVVPRSGEGGLVFDQ